jgi:hypothetical protein
MYNRKNVYAVSVSNIPNISPWVPVLHPCFKMCEMCRRTTSAANFGNFKKIRQNAKTAMNATSESFLEAKCERNTHGIQPTANNKRYKNTNSPVLQKNFPGLHIQPQTLTRPPHENRTLTLHTLATSTKLINYFHKRIVIMTEALFLRWSDK